MMLLQRLTWPDTPTGRWLGYFKAILEGGLLVLRQPTAQSMRVFRLTLRVKPTYTMVSAPRLANLYARVREANELGLPGAIVECGVWRGGASAVMATAFHDDGVAREMWLYDSFQGLPPPGEEDGSYEHEMFYEGWCRAATDEVYAAFRHLDVPTVGVHVVPGWFEDTLVTPGVDTIAVLHVDADWYDSVKTVLESLYDRVVPGGFVVFDDYQYWQGCRRAVDEFRQARGLTDVPLHDVAGTAVYFQKPQ